MFTTSQQDNDDVAISNSLIDLSAFEKYLSLKRILITLAIVLFLIAWNRGVALLYAMDALIVATLLIAWLVPKFNIRQIDVEITLPETANEGEDIPISIKSKKIGFFSRYMIEFWGDFPFAPPFESANLKNSGMKLLTKINTEATHTMRVPCELRGYYKLDTFNLRTGFPLGLITTERKVSLNPDKDTSILIYPKPLEVAQFDIANDPSHTALQLDNNPRVGGNDEYIGVREYRHGDNPRHIHWPTSAKRGDLIVREFQQNSTTHLTIILDLNQQNNTGEGRHSTLEYAIKITASLVKYAIDNQYSFTVFGLGKEPVEISVSSRSQSTNILNNALEALAWINADGDNDYSQAVRQHLAENRRGGTVVLFDSNNSPSNSSMIDSLLPELQAQHYYPLIYRFDSNSFASKNPLATRPRKNENNTMTIWQISSGCDLTVLFV